MSKNYRWCIIIFITVPSEKTVRKMWLEACGRNPSEFSNNSVLYVCEDHFDLKNDMKNYLQWKMVGGGRKRMRKNVVPHKNLYYQNEDKSDSESDQAANRPFKFPKLGEEVCSASTSYIQSCPEKHSNKAELVQETNMGATKQTALRSVGVLAKPNYRSRSIQTETQTESKPVDKATSPIKILKKPVHAEKLKPCILDNSSETTDKSSISIYLTLKKIKTAHTFAELADDFGISESTATWIFKNAVCLLSPLMKELIVWPPAEAIQRNLPTAFRARYGKVQSIIDCLEIEISKPRDSVKQALTWSEYKKANTIKYLISATPDGIINFVSNSYSGRTTDQVIVEECGYLNMLKPGMEIMADRGFKNIEKLLCDRHCRLVRPPSTKSGEKLSKEEVISTKRIASLRIHIERVIRRFLKPHACIHSKLIPFRNHIVYISCGLINLQGPLIKVN